MVWYVLKRWRLMLSAIVVGNSFAVYGLVVATLVASIIGTFIYSYPNKKELQYSYLQQVGDSYHYDAGNWFCDYSCCSVLNHRYYQNYAYRKAYII